MTKAGKLVVLLWGISVIAALCAFALHKGHNGAIFLSCIGTIGGAVAYAFGLKPVIDTKDKTDPDLMGPKLRLAIVVCLMAGGIFLAGCATTVSVEGCYFEEGIGKVCITATRAPDGVIDVKIHGDVASILSPETKRRILSYGKGLVTDAESSRSPD